MTTTEHADLIERINGHLVRLDKGSAVPGVGDQLLRHEHSTELLRSAPTALRTSYRDGWLGAADKLESEIPKTGGRGEQLAHVAVAFLRYNAPQEATDEA